MAFSHLFSSARIGTLELKNRLFQTAMGTNLANSDGTINDEIVAFYAARAAGGAALVTMGAVAVSYPHGQVQSRQVGISNDRFIPGLQRITAAVHQQGGRICAQLHHGGLSAACDMAAGRTIGLPSMPQLTAGPSIKDTMLPEELALSHFGGKVMPSFKEMTLDDIAQLIEDFAAAAARAVAAGFDAIEIHAAHSYIINSFLSPAENRRTDDYGGSPESRSRLLREVLSAIRQRIGHEFPMLCKINAHEFYIDGGLQVHDACQIARVAASAGADAITVSATHNYSKPSALFSSYLPHQPSKLVPLAAQIKSAVSIPVVTVGRIDLEVADKAIAAGQFDFMAMGRKQIADQDLTRHLAEGGTQAVRPCIYCYTCLSQAMLHQPLRCAVNADVGFEHANLLASTHQSRHVVVVGGGPGGMEAARRLALRGHQVTLMEASDQLGGTARIAAIAYAPNGDFVDWLKARLAELPIAVHLNHTATPANIAALEPDAVIVATGAIRKAPAIDGKHLPHVHDAASLRALLLGSSTTDEESDADIAKIPRSQRWAAAAARKIGVTNSPERIRQASKLWMPIGKRVVIIGGELVGLELAEFLHERGRQVTVVGSEEQFGRGFSVARRSVVLAELATAGVILKPSVSDVRITPNAVCFKNAQSTAEEAAADSVIIAHGAHPNTGLYDQLIAAGIDAHMVGDCSGVGYIQGAVRDAADIAAII